MVAWIILMSFKLVQDVMHRNLSLWFIIQSYLSTILMFTGIYMLVYCSRVLLQPLFCCLRPSPLPTIDCLLPFDFISFLSSTRFSAPFSLFFLTLFQGIEFIPRPLMVSLTMIKRTFVLSSTSSTFSTSLPASCPRVRPPSPSLYLLPSSLLSPRHLHPLFHHS